MYNPIVRLFFCLLVGAVSNPVLADEEEPLALSPVEHVAGLHPDPSILLEELIQPVSGSVCLAETDLVAKGAEPVALTRYFASPFLPVCYDDDPFDDESLRYRRSPRFGGWCFLAHTELSLWGREVRVAEPNGLTLAFEVGVDGVAQFKGDKTSLHNLSGDGPSGRYDPRNTRIEVLERGDRVVVHTPQGGSREYHKPSPSYSGFRRLLQREMLPNGKCLRYHYDAKYNPIRITSHDPDERYTYATLEQQIQADGRRFSTSTGQHCSYGLEARSRSITFEGKIGGGSVKRSAKLTAAPLLVRVDSPNYREEELAYSDHFLLELISTKDHVYRLSYQRHDKWGTPSRWILESVEAPVGEGGSFVPICKLQCDQGGRHSCNRRHRITYSDGAYALYDCAGNGLVGSVAHYSPEGQLCYLERYEWTEDNWLASRTKEDGTGEVLSKWEYSYDPFGNPVEERLTGNLTGVGLETRIIQRQFSDDGRHLLLEGAYESGLVKRLSYLPGTSLITSELICQGDQPLQRHFWEYDSCCNLVQEISDDGAGRAPSDLTGVTERRITRYQLRQESPFLHMREWIEESYWENGQELPLSKIHLHYDQWGDICREDCYDAKGALAFGISKEFDEQGNLLSETNPLCERETFTYDSRGRLFSSTPMSGRSTTLNTYDKAGRLIGSKTCGGDGLEEEMIYSYDLRNRLVEETNSLGHQTHHHYDPVSGTREGATRRAAYPGPKPRADPSCHELRARPFWAGDRLD